MTWQVQWEQDNKVRMLDVPQVVALEQAIAAGGTSLAELMDRAGASAAQFIRERWDTSSVVLIFCGTGNNGGDGWVVGQLLAEAGYPVTLVTPISADGITAHPAREAALRCVAALAEKDNAAIEVGPDEARIRNLVRIADVAVDALLGTGFHYDSLREPTRTYIATLAQVVAERDGKDADVRGGEAAAERSGEAAIERESKAGDASEPAADSLAARRPAVVAIDVPSGVNAQTGTATEPVVRADYTVTMMTLKTGLVKPEAATLCGNISVARIADIEKYLG